MVGLRIRIEELRTRWGVEGCCAYNSAMEGWYEVGRLVVVMVGDVTVVESDPKWRTVVPCPGVVVVVVVVVCGPDVAVVEVLDSAVGRPWSP